MQADRMVSRKTGKPVKPATLAGYQAAVNRLKRTVGDTALADIKNEVSKRLVIRMCEASLADKTIINYFPRGACKRFRNASSFAPCHDSVDRSRRTSMIQIKGIKRKRCLFARLSRELRSSACPSRAPPCRACSPPLCRRRGSLSQKQFESGVP